MIAGQVAVVTGASRGIGRAIAQALAGAGATVVVNYSRSAAEAEALIQEIRSSASSENVKKSVAMGFDVSNVTQVEEAFEKIIAEFGKIDILVNNAGIAVDGLLARTKPEDWARTIDVNLTSAFYCSKAVVKGMMKQRSGRIINISSVIGLMGNGGQTAYSASKAGLIGFTKSLAREVGSRNITVNAIAPGYIATDMTASISEEMKETLQRQIPLGRLGGPEDIAQAVLYLSSASYVTGEVLSVNGGMYM